MKNLLIFNFWLFAMFSSVMSFSSCSKNNVETPILSDQEKATLRFMREEEKLARDVYTYFYTKYGLNIFGNITSSEQTHMDAVLAVMAKYGIEDSASSLKGVFNNPNLQKLYSELIAKGEASLSEALIAGATIEDVDIKDLNEGLAATSNVDLKILYEKLKCGSRNHMRAFISQLGFQQKTYSPQFISKELYNEIISGNHEPCGRM